MGPATTLRILLVVDHLVATHHIGFLRPLARLRREGRCAIHVLEEQALVRAVQHDGEAAFLSLLDEHFRRLRPTLVCLSRYSGPRPELIQQFARGEGIPLLAHLDDDLFEIPETHGPERLRHYHDPVRQSNLRQAMGGCDLLYASTPALADRVIARGLRLPVVGGAISSATAPLPDATRPPRPAGQETIGYMGTQGHEADLELALPALLGLLASRPGLRIEIFGAVGVPAALARHPERVRHIRAQADYDAFLSTLAGLAWDVGLAPLRDTPFNACKTDTKWVEYAAAGIPAVVSDRPVYRHAAEGGAAMLVSDQGWREVLTGLVESPAGRASLRQRARARLEAEYSPARLEAQLLEILARLGARP
jgi:glycosyltransferase involved in cell wall biosynthesis